MRGFIFCFDCQNHKGTAGFIWVDTLDDTLPLPSALASVRFETMRIAAEGLVNQPLVSHVSGRGGTY